MIKSLGRLVLPLFTAIVGFGCSSSGGASTTTFTQVYTDVMTPHGCTAHHAPGALDSFLDLGTQAAAYKSLVGVPASGPACGGSGLTRVVAGSSSTSLLYEKVSEAKPPCGAQMPLGCPTGFSCLDAADQATIADWINGGAPNN